jgi:hypothetical protein
MHDERQHRDAGASSARLPRWRAARARRIEAASRHEGWAIRAERSLAGGRPAGGSPPPTR